MINIYNMFDPTAQPEQVADWPAHNPEKGIEGIFGLAEYYMDKLK